MASCLLFHGPGARSAAVDEAGRIGRLVADPFGDDGLRVDDARAFVGLMQSAPVGSDVGVVVACLDGAAPKTQDVLLKFIEEFDPMMVYPILWVSDIGFVSPTIRSRCLDRWSPSSGDDLKDPEIEAAARVLVQSALGGAVWEIPRVLKKFEDPHKMFNQVATILAEDQSPKSLALWERIRKVARWRNPTPVELLSALVPDP